MDMNIKEKIGQRIKQERLAKKLTRKELADLTENLKISSINNYERGDRTPGPNEIKQLAKALELSPAFLMCLSDDREGKAKKIPGAGTLVPVLDYKQACDPAFYIEQIKSGNYSDKVDFIPLSAKLSERIGVNAFALVVKDESMVPEFRIGDVMIIDPEALAMPSDFVAAKLDSDVEIIIRKYKQLSASKIAPEFELVAFNEDWANVHVKTKIKAEIIGPVIQIQRCFRNIY
ncbi:phage repressor [Legionella taurinensis]|nr:phage repressor [Legionella taurinensis]